MKENTKLTDSYAEELVKKEKARQSDTIKKSIEKTKKKKALLAKLKALKEEETDTESSSESEEEKPKKKSSKKKGKGLDSDILEYLKQF